MGKAAARNVTFALEADDKEEENDGNDENADEFGTDGGDDHVSHSLYRDIIAKDFDKRSPLKLASNKLTYFPIDGPVTRTLAA